MLVLIVAVIFGLAIGYFATQNVTPVTIQIADYVWNDVPLYQVVIGSLLIGLFLAWILYLVRSVSSTLTWYGRNHAARRATVTDLERRVHELESENARLRAAHSPAYPRDDHPPVRTEMPHPGH
ncbi:MAG: LapA family protein [Deltaproteobacteria bacterium]|nr:LapA family protein [Deltaproteobacteria bacterium]